jgi:prevent-host-death family protein
MIRSANIAEVKNRLSKYLQLVRSGEQVVIRDRNLPVAKLVPISPSDASAEELTLAANGELALPSAPFDEEDFWSIGARVALREDLSVVAARSVSDDREERDASLLGR